MPFPSPSNSQARLLWWAVSAVAVVVLVAALCVLIWGLGQVLHVLSPVLWPLAIAGVLAYLLDPVVGFLVQRRVPRTRAILVVFALAITLFTGLIGSVVPAVVSESRDLFAQRAVYAERLNATLKRWTSDPPRFVQKVLRFLPGSRPPATNAPAAPVGTPPATNTPAAADAATVPAVGTLRPAEGPGATESLDAAEENFWEQWLAEGRLDSVTDWLARVLPKLGSQLLGGVGRLASSFGFLAGLALIPIYLFYFLLEKRGIESRWTDYLPVANSRFKEELVFVLSSINDYLIAFFRGQVLVAICDGVLYTLGFLLMGLPMAVLIGVVATVLTIIPFLGAIVTCGSALIVAIVHFGDFTHPLLVLAVFAVVQTLEGFVIQPKIVGDRVGLHPLAIIIALMVGTSLFGGLLGGILAIPFTAALRVVMFRYVWKAPTTGQT